MEGTLLFAKRRKVQLTTQRMNDAGFVKVAGATRLFALFKLFCIQEVIRNYSGSFEGFGKQCEDSVP